MPDIDRRRRFVFRGNAAAIGGRIVRPKDVILESGVASSLTVAGGRSVAKGAGLRFGESIAVKSASTLAEGLFDSVKQHRDLTHRRVTADALATTTRVVAEVAGLQVGVHPRLTIKRLRGALTARSPITSGEPQIAVEATTLVEGVAIDGYPLTVELSLRPFQVYDTRSKLLMAADDTRTAATIAPVLLTHSRIHGVPLPPAGRLIESQGTIYATLATAIRWTRQPYPGAKIVDHTVRVPGFGKIIFGELLITDLSRRLTMLRLELGSHEGGDVAAAEVESNGIWT